MPRGYDAPGYVAGTLGEQIISRGSSHRSTKSFFPSHNLAFILGACRNRSEFYAKLFRGIHAKETGVVLDDDELRSLYPVIQGWEDIHQQLVDHAVSVGATSINAVTGAFREEVKQRDPQKEESSGGERWK